MGRPGRTLLVIGVMAIVCVAALMGMANRYNKILAKRTDDRPVRSAPVGSVATFTPPTPPRQAAAPSATPDEQALAFVDAFVGVRQSLRAALEAASGATPSERLAILERVRERALEAHDIDLSEYRQVRALWRGWRDTGTAPTPPFERAFTERAEQVAAADLGAMEAYD